MSGKRIEPLRQLSGLTLAIADLLAIGIVLIVFALFDHVIPRTVAVPVQPQTEFAEKVPEIADISEEPAEAVKEPAPEAGFGEKFAGKFTNGEIISDENSYKSANINVTFTQHDEYLEGIHLNYCVEDIYIRNIECLRTAFAKDTFGKAITDKFSTMCKRNNAIAAINSDYYGYGSAGICIRNGVLYRDTFEPGEDVLVIYRDGTMQVYKEGGLDVNEAMRNGAWQSFSFGPGLLDGEGNMLDSYEKINHDPRTIIGMVEPGHYMFIVVDGRQGGWSEGLTYRGCGLLASQYGLKVAYNLDGGRTSQMAFMNRLCNKPYKNGRPTSDIVYIGEVE